MDCDNQLAIYCEDDGEYRVYCNICNSICIQRFYKKHQKSKKHINNVRKTEELNQINSTKLISINGENYDIIYYPEDNENRVYCNVCNIFYIDRFFKKHLKSKKHINNQIISSNLI